MNVTANRKSHFLLVVHRAGDSWYRIGIVYDGCVNTKFKDPFADPDNVAMRKANADIGRTFYETTWYIKTRHGQLKIKNPNAIFSLIKNPEVELDTTF